jgi:peptide/nickel transport system permease protein
MTQYIIKRVLLLVPTLLGISIFTFCLIRIVPGDVLDVMYADSPLSTEEIEKIRDQLGMNKPIYVQYWDWISGLAHLDAGKSLWTRRPTLQEIADRLPVTIQLALMAFVIQLVIAIPLGVLAATNQDRPQDQVTRFFAILLNATPDFWIATIAIVFLASTFGWIPPIGGVASFKDNPGVNLQQFMLPALILGIGGAASLTRYTRNQLLEVIRQDYIRTAFAKGLAARRVWYVHAIKNAMIPVITNAGSHLGHLMGGTVIIENIFSLPGVGQLTLSAIHHRDVPQLEINVLFLATVFVVVNLLVDLTYGWLDPRIRYS